MKKRFYIILILVAVFNQLGVAVNLPTSGAATANSCGTAVTVYDNGGSASNYSNSVSGYIVLNCSGLATINISGTYATESGWDYVNIYDGSGTGGTLLSQYTGNGSINYTGKCGQTLTIQLTSDGSTTASGIALNVTYSGSCTAYSSLNIPASGNNSVSCGTNTLLYLNNGSGNYSNSDNGYTVLNCSGSGQISLCGIGNTESTWDYIYIYAGVGTGGTLLASYTGTGQSISYTGAVGQALTIKFTSDGSTNYSGTYINVTYIANCCTPPTSQATSLSVTTGACGSTNLTATWTRGNGNNVLVVCTAGSASTGPTSGTAYTANTVYGSGTACGGGFCVYNGTGTSVTVTGLTAGNTYYIDVYEYLNASTCYLSPSLSGNVSIAAGGNNSCGCATDITSSFNAVSTAALVTTYSCSISGTNAGATADEASTSCFTNGQNVWYKFTPAYSGSYYAGVNSGSGTMDYPEVAILSGTCGGFTNLGCAGVTSTTKKPYGYYDDVYDPYYSYAGACNLVAGNTYYIMVDNAYGTSYRGTFTLTVSSLSNDGPSTAAILPSCGINYSSSTIGATNCNNCTGSGTSANNNLDCNASTSVGSGSGSDVYAGMTVENDSWYAFCTTSPGTYTLTLSAVDATCIGPDALTSSELQCNIYTGVGALSYTALGYQYGDYFGDLWDEVIPISLAANGCCWVEVDGYAGTNCDYTLNLTGACTLPIHLLNFTGENADNNKIRLKWSTASEEQNNHYLIERSADGFNYKHMAELKGAGTSSSRHDYETLDENPLDGVNYYRLTTIDLNGKADVASSIAVTHKAHLPSFSVYPNPAKNFMNVDMNNFSSSTVNLDVVDMYGRTVWSSELNTVDGGSKTQIDLSNFAGGMYFVKVYDGSNFYKKSVFVSKEN